MSDVIRFATELLLLAAPARDGQDAVAQDTGAVYRWFAGLGWQKQAASSASTSGTWSSGTTVPDNSVGSDGNFYVRTTTGDVYLKSSGAWTLIGSWAGAASGGAALTTAFVWGTSA